MCGIAGAISAQESRTPVERMTAALHHRGPDDSGFAILAGPRGTARGTFGHRRLAILDLSPAGHQPMRSSDGRYCINYNGEIYNYRELRDELAHDGAQFRSSGDTEVILAGWAKWGPGVLSRLRGMFAFALWDRDEERCYLARDAFGIKPLYVSESNGTILFASEIRALLASASIPRTLSRAAVRSYLATGSVAEPLTIIESVRAVAPGCFVPVGFRQGKVVPGVAERFTSALTMPEKKGSSPTEAAPSRLRQILRDSVAHHLVSDVPVALFLSGGLDSSSVVALASEVSATRLDSFTVTFTEADYSEAAHARTVADRFGTRHHEVPLSGQDVLDALPDAFAAMDQPSLDGLNTYVVSRAVRSQGIKVVLSGLGGDELFGGYPSFRRAKLIAPMWKLPAIARQLGASGAGLLHDPRMERLGFLFRGATPAYGAYLASRTLFSEQYVRSLSGGEADDVPPMVSADDVDIGALSLLQQVSLHEITGYMRNTLLRDSDVFSMAHGLELRVPFVDREVLRVAMSFADSARLRAGVSKPVLVDAMRDLLPASVLSRRKQGFTLPFDRWMRKDLFDEVDAVLTSSISRMVGLEPGAASDVWSDFQGRRHGISWSRPWALYTLVRWAEQNNVTLGGDIERNRAPSISFAAAR